MLQSSKLGMAPLVAGITDPRAGWSVFAPRVFVMIEVTQIHSAAGQHEGFLRIPYFISRFANQFT